MKCDKEVTRALSHCLLVCQTSFSFSMPWPLCAKWRR